MAELGPCAVCRTGVGNHNGPSDCIISLSKALRVAQENFVGVEARAHALEVEVERLSAERDETLALLSRGIELMDGEDVLRERIRELEAERAQKGGDRG